MNLFVGRKISLEALKDGYFRVMGWNVYPGTSSEPCLDEAGVKDGEHTLGKEIVRLIGGP